ncbi:MAG: hypothetical protein VZS44_09915 [Bacilli bacterium]|nr:hypothetical protein [Bacilli bacterium]
MDIIINGSISLRFAPDNLKDNMTTQELMDSKIYGYIEEQFKDGDCVIDSFEWNVKGEGDYNEILDQYKIENKDYFSDYFYDYISEHYMNDYIDKEYIFKRTIFEEGSDLDYFTLQFELTLCITLEQLCEKYLSQKG